LHESAPESKNYLPELNAEAVLGGANAAQREAIFHHRGPMLVLAGPGSGKTFVITRRIQYLITGCGAEPSSILVITFTKAAASQMQSRFSENTKDSFGEVRFGTFHSVFFSIIKKHYRYSIEDLVTPTQQRMYMKQVILHTDLELTADLDTIEELIAAVSCRKNLGETKSGTDTLLEPEQFERVYRAYQEQMEWNHKIDFDDMLLLCRELFRKKPQVCSYWQRQFAYILVDEFQDINPLQYEILRLLALPEDNLFVVGDDDQAIYGFRGSKPEILLHFPQEYQDARTVYLNRNYRSGNAIVDAANLVIRENQVRFDKELRAGRQGGTVSLLGFDESQEERQTIVRYLQESEKAGESCALLCRTNRELEAWARVCDEEGIRYRHRIRPQNIWREEYGKDLAVYLKTALGKGEREDLLRILNRPMRYLSRECIGETGSLEDAERFYSGRPGMREAVMKLRRDLKRIAGLSPFLAVQYICKGIGYEAWALEQGSGSHGGERRRAIKEGLERCSREAAAAVSLTDFLNGIQTDKSKEQGEWVEVEAKLSLLTYHASKGLEFHTVFLPGINDGKVPHGKNLSASELEEERRMFYVAMTRAKEKLFLSYTCASPSPFLKPLKKAL